MTAKQPRPTSPHLQVYKLPLTGLISISHRITGVFLCLGIVLLVMMFYTVSQGQGDYDEMQILMNSWLMKFLLLGFLFALCFHFCHGIRHLLWDVGSSFTAEKLQQFALAELATAVVLTFVVLAII